MVFRQRSSFFKGRLLSKVVLRERLTPIKVVFFQRFPPSKVLLHRRSPSSFGSLFFGFSPECGIVAYLTFLFFVICVFELVYLIDLHYFSLWAGPPQWPFLRWISQQYCWRGRHQRGPKILNICHTKSYRTKNWGRILPGIIRSRLATSYDVWRRRAA